MTFDQIAAFATIAIMMALMVWGRVRYDLVAVMALLAAVAVGIVPYDRAFSGFSDDIVIIVASALVVSAIISRTGIMDLVVHRLFPQVRSVPTQLFLLVTTVAVLSAFVKNIGALAIMLPVAFQMANRSKVSVSIFLMPMAFGALLGGLMTLVGTSPNIIVSRLREEMTGTPFSMFDFTPVGAALTVAGILFLVVGYRLLPLRSGGAGGVETAIDIKNYMTEALLPSSSKMVGKTVAELQKLSGGDARINAIVRKEKELPSLPDAQLRENDIIMIEGKQDALDRLILQGGLQLSSDRLLEVDEAEDEIDSIEAVISENSRLVGLSAKDIGMFEVFRVNLLAISRQGTKLRDRLGSAAMRAGDVIVLQGNSRLLPEVLRELGCLPLAERSIRLGSVRRALIPVAILAVAILLTAFGIVPVSIAFFGAAALMVLARGIPLRDLYETIEWPIIIMLGALIPVSDALRTTGGTQLVADALSSAAMQMSPMGALALIMITAMAVTPFLNNAATVLVMAPIAASFATQLQFRPDAFLMAVAIGAGCDFLTPIGHQCNTLVMGPGGYRFGDYWRLGLPLSVIVVIVGVPLLLLLWPVN
ncbi:di/tricarboxylate transporter [Rhodoligotrophos appendicifer]|uniref:SLC13 family permease n=1 Tax=Rhodoligotrophos appendicifer TaxID=987056 RepID=UPI0011814922